MSIHSTAIISPSARLDPSVCIGPYVIVEEDVEIGANTKIESHVVVKQFTTIGEENRIGTGTVLGAEPQDLKFKGEKSFLKVGNENTFREYVTVHRACGKGLSTVIGDNNVFMTQSHLGHNCIVGNHAILTNWVSFSGHCTIESYSIIGGMTGVHQFVRIGKYSFVGGYSAIRQDIPPFSLCEGNPCRILGVNRIGLQRHGFDAESLQALSLAFKQLFFSRRVLKKAMAEVEHSLCHPLVQNDLLTFLKASSRGVARGRTKVKKEKGR